MAYSEQEILAGLAEIVSEETGLPADSVTPEKSFTDDLDIDSLSMMTIVTSPRRSSRSASPTTRSTTSSPSATPSATSTAPRPEPCRPGRRPGVAAHGRPGTNRAARRPSRG